MRQRFFSFERIVGAVAPLCLMLAPALHGQDAVADPTFAGLPVSQWFTGGNISQIPWKVEISTPYLSYHQRYQVDVEVTVSGRDLLESGFLHDLALLVRITQGDRPGVQTVLRLELDEQLPRRNSIVFTQPVLVRPGEYRVGVLLYDHTTQLRSVTLRGIRFEAPKDDPLPHASRDLPPFEFLTPAEGLDLHYRPDITNRLFLPLATRRPLELTVLLNASSRSSLLPTLKVLSHLALANGTLRLLLLDVSRRRILFDQPVLRELDWPAMRASLTDAKPFAISVKEMQAAKENAAFLRQTLADLLSSPRSRGSNSHEPLRVVLLLSAPMEFASGSDLTPVAPPEGCLCRMYHLQYMPQMREPIVRAQFRQGPSWLSEGSEFDQISGLLSPLKPRTFRIYSPEDFRKALAAMLQEIPTL